MAASNGLAYRPRIADAKLRACLSSAGAVVIEGPKACGKTRLAQQLAASTVLLDVDLAARQALAVDPALVLVGPGRVCWMSGRWRRCSGTRCGELWMRVRRLGKFCIGGLSRLKRSHARRKEHALHYLPV